MLFYILKCAVTSRFSHTRQPLPPFAETLLPELKFLVRGTSSLDEIENVTKAET
jgi:hypothetical protein